MTGVGQDGADAVAQRVVSVAYGGALAVVDGGFADEAVEFVVGEFDAAVLVAGFGQVAGNRVVVETGAADAFVFALSVAAGDFAALFFDQLAEDVAFKPVDVPSFGTVFQTTLAIALTVFGLLNQLSGGIVAVGGDFAVPAGFLDQVVGLVVIETVGFAVFIGENGQTAGFVVGVGEGMAQRVGNGFEIAVFGVTETGSFADTVGKADELAEGVVV